MAELINLGRLRFLVSLACLLSAAGSLAQNGAMPIEKEQAAYMEISKVGLTASDVSISASHYSKHNDVHHIYLQQVYQDIDIWGAQANMVIRDKVEVSHMDLLVSDISTKAIILKNNLSPYEAVRRLASHLNLSFAKSKGKLVAMGNDSYKISGLPYAKNEVNLTPVWSEWEGQYYKSWKLRLESNLGPDDYIAIVNGYSGEVVEVINRTISCEIDTEHNHDANSPNISLQVPKMEVKKNMNEIGDGQYRVFAMPVESPNHGNRSLVDSPADEEASPFGWHDTNGMQGPEYTISRGNNVHVYHDQSADDQSEGDEPDGGNNLIFDFPFSGNASVEENLEADITNLFYWNNLIHDWSYKFGFNESSGNFQENNYGNGGMDGDYVRAETLDGEDTGNANFSAPEDGSRGRMQMYKWIVGGEFEVFGPASIASVYPSTASNFGPAIKPQISGSIAIAQDGVDESGDVCEPIINSAELSGQVALVDRGICDFSAKVYSVQEAGALACIVCNNIADAPLVSMGGGANEELVVIPAIFISKENCQLIKDQISLGIDVPILINKTREASSALDNGIVAHEYAHGISLRLVGGANKSNCLNNDEQMGEGWSDFFGLVLTRTPEDRGGDARGVGTYVLGESTEGRGIRRYQYSTDMSINPQTHSHIRATSTAHPLGEIWMTALWEMYWLYVDAYGYDDTWEDRSSGNFRAVQNVIDGMKIQPCDASLLQARDAIITADAINYFSEGECLIWQAFAKRGMGVDAIGGNGNWRYDNVDGFDLPQSCKSETVSRMAPAIVEAGDEITVTIDFWLGGNQFAQYSLSDEIPMLASPNVSFGEVLTPGISVRELDTKIFFESDDTADPNLRSISYTLKTQGMSPADFTFYDGFEGKENYAATSTNMALNPWQLTQDDVPLGIFALDVQGSILAGEAYATLTEPVRIDAQSSLLRFDQKYDTQLGFDGGVIEVSTDRGSSWTPIAKGNIISGGYQDAIAFDFRYTNVQDAYTGQDSTWHGVLIDMSSYIGSEVLLRFNYVQQDFLEIESYQGWTIDNIEVFENKGILGMTRLVFEADGGAEAQSTTYIASNARTTPTIEIINESSPMKVTPNPTTDIIWAAFNSDKNESGQIRIISIDGKIIQSEGVDIKQGKNVISKDVYSLVSGAYILEVRSKTGIRNQKFIKQ